MTHMPLKNTAPLAVDPVSEKAVKYFGKYRGVVQNNIDPLQVGRIIASVPDALGLVPSTWALPCVPYASVAAYDIPPIGTQVWIEFEQGDADFPIWSGCWAALNGATLFK